MLATSLLRSPGLRPAVAFVREKAAEYTLTPLNRSLCERLARISPHQGHRERADAIDELHKAFSDRLCQHWHALGSPDRDGLDEGKAWDVRHNRRLSANFKDMLQHGPRLLRSFGPIHEGKYGMAASCPSLGRLRGESGEVFANALEQKSMRPRALAYAAVIDPRAYQSLGITLKRPEDRRDVEHLQVQVRGGLLDALSVLQLRDYAHAYTESFNFYRSVDLLQALVPDEVCCGLFRDLIDGLHRNVQRVFAVEPARVRGPACKGWITTQALPLHAGREFEFHRPTSATAQANASYVLKHRPGTRPYDLNLHFEPGAGPGLAVQAVHFALFNAPHTVEEDEVLVLPGQRFRVVKLRHEDLMDGNGRRPVTQCLARRIA